MGSYHAMEMSYIGESVTDRRIGAPHDWMAEIGVEICPWSARKSDAKSRGHIHLGHASIDEWKQIFLRVRAAGPGPISVLI